MVKYTFPGSIPHINFHHWAAGVPLATSIAHKGALAGAQVMAAAIVECLKNPGDRRGSETHLQGRARRRRIPPPAAASPEAPGQSQPRHHGEIPASHGRAPVPEGEADVPLTRLRAFNRRDQGVSPPPTPSSSACSARPAMLIIDAILSDGFLSAASELRCPPSRRGLAMRRRTFMAGFSSTLLWPAWARAQQPAAQQRSLPVVAFIGALSPETSVRYLDEFRRGLGELGYVEGRNVVISYHWLKGDYDVFPRSCRIWFVSASQ